MDNLDTYDWACIGDGIVYHFINFRQVWKLELDSFDQEISAGETVIYACSLQYGSWYS